MTLKRERFKSAILRTIVVALLYIVAYKFYNIEIVREEVEDIAFDIVDKFHIESTPTDTKGPKVLLFAVDDLYMKAHGLYDEENESDYGYLFPRDKLADFIEELDEFTEEAEPTNRPRALFVDYDMSFTTLPYGKELSKEDRKLLTVLRRDRSYTIVLPKTSRYNFVQYSDDRRIRDAIKKKKIVFASVPLLEDEEGVVRRYRSIERFKDLNESGEKEYPSVDLLLWQLIREKEIDPDKLTKRFLEDDIVGNRILIKSYDDPIVQEGCSFQKSHWLKLERYSANCSLFDIVEEDFAGAVVMLGAVHRHNEDRFKALDVAGSEELSGIDLHANTLMTLLYLNGPLGRLGLWQSLLIVSVVFFVLAYGTSVLFSSLGIENEETEFVVLLALNSIILIAVSIYFLDKEKLWFNWFVPLILYEIVEIYDIAKEFVGEIISKMKRRIE